MDEEQEKVGMSKGTLKTVGTIAAVLGAVGLIGYGGMKLQTHMDSQKPYGLIARGESQFFVDRVNRKEFPAAEVAPTYMKVDALNAEIGVYKKNITAARSTLSQAGEALSTVNKTLGDLVGQ